MIRLGELERKVMEVLWAAGDNRGRDTDGAGGLTGRDVDRLLPGYAYTTLSTVLERLQRKGLVERRREGRAFRYAAVTTRSEYTARLMHEALGAAGDRNDVLVRFAESVSADEAAVLRQALADGTPQGSGRRGAASAVRQE